MVLRTISLYLFLVIFSEIASAQFIGYRIDNQNQKASFRFELINNLIIVPVIVNDSVPMCFILDTGVRTTLLTNENLDKLEVAYSRPVVISGLGTAKEIKAYLASNVTLHLPGITGKGQTLIVLGEDYLNLQNHLGVEVHGVLGYDFFNHFIVQINYDSKQINVYNPGHFKKGKKYTSFDLVIENGRPYIDANFIQLNGVKNAGRFLIDSGASHSLLLETDKDSTLAIPEKTINTIVGWGLGGEIEGELGRLKSFNLGDFEFKNVMASFVSGLQSPKLISGEARIGSIGGELISRFTTVYDYRNSKLYIRKNNQFKRGFEYNLSGIDLTASGKDFKTFTVVHITEDSPAAEVGVMRGDIIIGVNAKGAGWLTLDEINALFRSQIGTQINLIVLRDNSFQSFRFRLRRII
ncbi:MAG: aspartyl protease family protein [Bacteroidales bacterium]|nr:aspartyl protease family protein [Bacteroidales bacterium]